MKWIGICLVLSLAVGLLAACAPASSTGDVENPATTEEPGAAPTPRQGVVAVPSETPAENQPAEAAPVQQGAYSEEAASLVKQAQDDLAQRLGVPLDQIAVVSVSEVVWPDGSLGCPQPGLVYTQATMPGYQIILSTAALQYDYHADMRRAFLCESRTPFSKADKGNLAPEVKLVNMAIDDLAGRLGIDRSLIIPQPLVPTKWPDSSLGCPEAGQDYTPGEKTGYEITLKVNSQAGVEQVYTYHSDLERVVFCER